jgi:quercetin dioxygenase-like cupin family protein
MSEERMTDLRDIEEVGPLPIWDGVVARAIEGEHITFSVVELAPNAVVPEHRHPNEQIGMVIQGSGRFRVGDEERDVRPGSTWRVLADVPHEMHVGPEGAVVIDVFTPLRSDWRAFTPDQPRPTVWPASEARSR